MRSSAPPSTTGLAATGHEGGSAAVRVCNRSRAKSLRGHRVHYLVVFGYIVSRVPINKDIFVAQWYVHFLGTTSVRVRVLPSALFCNILLGCEQVPYRLAGAEYEGRGLGVAYWAERLGCGLLG